MPSSPRFSSSHFLLGIVGPQWELRPVLVLRNQRFAFSLPLAGAYAVFLLLDAQNLLRGVSIPWLKLHL